MYRTFGLGLVALGLLALMTVFSMAGAAKPAAAAANPGNNYYFNFEQGVAPWTATTSGAGSQEAILERATGDNGCPDLHGNAYAVLKVTDVPPGGPVPATKAGNPLPVGSWIVTGFPADSFSTVAVEFAAKDAGQCAGCHPMIYIGNKPPTTAAQFKIDSRKLSRQWQDFKTAVNADSSTGTVFVAIGWDGTDASMGLDCISVNIGNGGPAPVPFPK